MKVMSFSIRPELADRLEAEAAAAGISINQLLRNILEARDWAIRSDPANDEWLRRRPKKKGFLEEFFS